jgi:hypothetical protein
MHIWAKLLEFEDEQLVMEKESVVLLEGEKAQTDLKLNKSHVQ